ncbi:hypothetical protein BBP40_001552 [Aspergillus hancockii]|nr:hypothetical protein BBP40_001552 [Aspergillus hancockii]
MFFLRTKSPQLRTHLVVDDCRCDGGTHVANIKQIQEGKSPALMTSFAGPSRRQYSSCDACRRSKRRCRLEVPKDTATDAICTNCKRLGYSCTFDFARSRVAPRRSRRRNPITAVECDGPNALNSSDELPEIPIASQGVLASWLDFDLDPCLNDDGTPFLENIDLPGILAGACPETPPADHQANTFTYLLPNHPDTVRHSNHTYPVIGGSPRSPISLLNSKINATLLDECLARIHDTIVTGCASRFIHYDCNLSATRSRYRLESNFSSIPREEMPAKLDPPSDGNSPKPGSISQSDISSLTSGHSARESESTLLDHPHLMTVIGTVRFLDHFSDLYGNRLSGAARRQSDAVFKAVLRAFSLQWLSPVGRASDTQLSTHSNSPDGKGTTRDSLVNAFYDSWFQARSLIRDALPVQSFRVVYAILMFDGIAIPAKDCGKPLVAHEFLDAGLQKLYRLDGLVRQYCANLGPLSTYGAIAEASLSVVRWCGHVRDIGAALTMAHQCTLPYVADQEKDKAASSTLEPILPWSDYKVFHQDLDDIVPSICREAVAEAFRTWRQVVDVKTSLLDPSTKSRPNMSNAITSTINAISGFTERFRPFLTSCVTNLRHLSMRSRLSSVSILVFWDLGVLVLVDALKPTMSAPDPSFRQDAISSIQAYREEAASSIAHTMECVLSLPPEEIFNLQNGMSTEASIITYHITPSLMAAALQKAIENIIDMQFSSAHGLEILESGCRMLNTDNDWRRQIDAVMKGLISLDVTIGGSQVASVAIQDLMQRYWDVISECWSCGFETKPQNPTHSPPNHNRHLANPPPNPTPHNPLPSPPITPLSPVCYFSIQADPSWASKCPNTFNAYEPFEQSPEARIKDDPYRIVILNQALFELRRGYGYVCRGDAQNADAFQGWSIWLGYVCNGFLGLLEVSD